MKNVFFVFIAFIVFPISVWAADMYSVNIGATVQITEHSVCQRVTNNHSSGRPIMVPTKTSTEWTSFRNNRPAGVGMAACPTGGVWASYDSGCTGGTDTGIKVISPPPGAVNLGNGHPTVINGTACSPIGQKGYSSVFPSPCGTFGGAPRMAFLYNCQ